MEEVDSHACYSCFYDIGYSFDDQQRAASSQSKNLYRPQQEPLFRPVLKAIRVGAMIYMYTKFHRVEKADASKVDSSCS